jgi:hypothetical protein
MWLESSNVKHHSRVDDPWFTATSARDVPLWARSSMGDKYYVPDDTAQVLGCSTNFQLCNPNAPEPNRCYDLATGSISSIDSTFLEIWPKEKDRDIMVTYAQYLVAMFAGTTWHPANYYNVKGLTSLMTRFTLAGVMQTANIPSNRWQEEVEYIFHTNLAATQSRFVELATGRIRKTSEAFATLCGASMNCTRLCQNQVSLIGIHRKRRRR